MLKKFLSVTIAIPLLVLSLIGFVPYIISTILALVHNKVLEQTQNKGLSTDNILFSVYTFVGDVMNRLVK